MRDQRMDSHAFLDRERTSYRGGRHSPSRWEEWLRRASGWIIVSAILSGICFTDRVFITGRSLNEREPGALVGAIMLTLSASSPSISSFSFAVLKEIKELKGGRRLEMQGLGWIGGCTNDPQRSVSLR